MFQPDLPIQAGAPSVPIPANRSQGALRLSFKPLGPATVPHDFFQSGCLRARLLAAEGRRHGAEMVMINTSGGLTGGDRLSVAAKWRTGSEATLTTQAAEKIYRAESGRAETATVLTLAPGSRAAWLPQETILFDRAALHRDNTVRMAGDAAFLGLEAYVLGRTAMAESVSHGYLRDGWRIWRDGRLIYADALELSGPIAATLAHAAVAQGAIAFATMLCVAPATEGLLEPVREALGAAAGRVAASAWNGILAIRFLAAGGSELRADIFRALAVVRPGRALPRVWRC